MEEKVKSAPANATGNGGDDCMRLVGQRVRTARSRKGLSRRVLSETSGVSERYLAQLESGTGNISISLLWRVSKALDVPLDWLVGEEDPWLSETVTLISLFQAATAEQKRQVWNVLDRDGPGVERAGRIALIGLRGSGKSTLGRLAAEKLGLPFVELNKEIEDASGIPVNEIFALYGQEGYRRLERQAVERIVETRDAVVLAVSGGIVSEPATYDYLLRHTHTIWLRAQPSEHMDRVRAQGDERPMAGSSSALKELRDILSSREELYARANIEVDTSGQSVTQSLQEVLDAIRANKCIVKDVGQRRR